MRLNDILQRENIFKTLIEYYTYVDIDGEPQSIFIGLCEYSDNELRSVDGDTYSLNDNIIKYEKLTNDQVLRVWER